MNMIINYTSGQYNSSISGLQEIEDINEITFIIPIFLFFQNNFKFFLKFAHLLNKRPLIKTHVRPEATQDQLKQLEKYNTALVLGTFDHLHLGHQVLLLKAVFSSSQLLIIEVKDDSLMKNIPLKQLIQSVDVRKENIRKFLDTFIKQLKPQLEIKIQVITEPYGSAPYSRKIDAIAITEQSIHSFKHINKMRKSKKAQMIIAPLITNFMESAPSLKQNRIDAKISSIKVRKYLLKQNNLTLAEYLNYRGIWYSLVKQINCLCLIKDIDFIIAERWWQRVIYKYSRITKIGQNKQRKSNHEVFMQISWHNNRSTPNQQSLNEVATNLALLFDGIEDQEKNLQGVVKNFLENLLKKKGKSKTCKKIRKMILQEIKEFVQKSNAKKNQTAKSALNQTARSASNEASTSKTQNKTFQLIKNGAQPEINKKDVSLDSNLQDSINNSKSREVLPQNFSSLQSSKKSSEQL